MDMFWCTRLDKEERKGAMAKAKGCTYSCFRFTRVVKAPDGMDTMMLLLRYLQCRHPTTACTHKNRSVPLWFST